jgi:hypothetical protein
VAASIKLDDLLAAFPRDGDPTETSRPCSAVSLAWLSDSAVAVVLKQEHAEKTSRRVFVFSCMGYAAELKLKEGDEVCHVSAEMDGCVVLGEHTWTLVRDVPVAIQRVRNFLIIHACMNTERAALCDFHCMPTRHLCDLDTTVQWNLLQTFIAHWRRSCLLYFLRGA